MQSNPQLADSQGTTDSQMSSTSSPPDELAKQLTLPAKEVGENQVVTKELLQIPVSATKACLKTFVFYFWQKMHFFIIYSK